MPDTHGLIRALLQIPVRSEYLYTYSHVAFTVWIVKLILMSKYQKYYSINLRSLNYFTGCLPADPVVSFVKFKRKSESPGKSINAWIGLIKLNCEYLKFKFRTGYVSCTCSHFSFIYDSNHVSSVQLCTVCNHIGRGHQVAHANVPGRIGIFGMQFDLQTSSPAVIPKTFFLT